MEEKKSKVVDMKGKADTKQQKLTYEQLNDACNQLFQQNQQLYKKINELNTYNAFRRLDYLFKVVEIFNKIVAPEGLTFTEDFVKSCIKEIQDAMTIKEEPDEETKE